MTECYHNKTVVELAELLPGRTHCMIYNRAYVLDLKKDKDWVKNLNRDLLLKAGMKSRIQPGSIPHNKGQRGLKPFHKPETFFPKGHMPHNLRPVGSERISKDGYVEVKVSEPKKWMLKHRHVWEQHHKTPVPKGHIVTFKDRDKHNFAIENLEAITMKANRLRNSWAQDDRDEYIAHLICGKKDREHRSEVLKDKPLLDLKRKQLQLQKSLKPKKNDTGRD